MNTILFISIVFWALYALWGVICLLSPEGRVAVTGRTPTRTAA